MQDNIKLNDYEIEHNKFLRENGALQFEKLSEFASKKPQVPIILR